MEKAIVLVDDYPETCSDCMFFAERKGQKLCTASDFEIFLHSFDNFYEERCVDCPLKELPKKKDEYKEALKSFNGNMSKELHFACEGWNACLDEILGEEE